MPRKLYGAQTEMAMKNFPISGWPMPEELICSLALLKEHAARVNGELKQIPSGIATSIAVAASSIKSGKYMDQFPVDVFQTGSGTSTNMNMNEVLASLSSRKGKKVHPNDHVNCSQSSNDVIPSAIQIALALKVRDELLPALKVLEDALQAKGKAFKGVIKTGRTHLMDAVPVRMGDEFAAFATLIHSSSRRLKGVLPDLCELPLGGTAVGTGLNAHPQFAKKVIARMKNETKLPLKEVSDHPSSPRQAGTSTGLRIAAQSCPLVLQSLSSALAGVAVALTKIANDIRLMGSGPSGGFAEIILPELQPGSSAMPGKVNPVLCESVEQVAAWVLAGDTMVNHCIAQGSRMELHTCYPIVGCKLISSTHLLMNVSAVFAKKCVRGIKVHQSVIDWVLGRNPILVTALAKEIGYDEAAKIAKESTRSGQTILEVAQNRTRLNKKKLQSLLDPGKMV